MSTEEAQELVNAYAGTGALIRTKSRKWSKQEVVTSNDVIGYDVNDLTVIETATKIFKIHYSNKGTHIVPKRE
ncbi:polymorphic toxin type 50 domain-containing protein [Ruminococcus sp. zg-921]|uniref:polymorphic toxin type 50 domain-containing protein n=1 Tax=unclassified Ruminococcus TaxID=2608920 RepID=UPI00210951BB